MLLEHKTQIKNKGMPMGENTGITKAVETWLLPFPPAILWPCWVYGVKFALSWKFSGYLKVSAGYPILLSNTTFIPVYDISLDDEWIKYLFQAGRLRWAFDSHVAGREIQILTESTNDFKIYTYL